MVVKALSFRLEEFVPMVIPIVGGLTVLAAKLPLKIGKSGTKPSFLFGSALFPK